MKRLIIVLTALLLATASRAEDAPKYGGTLHVGTAFITLSALSFDPADWPWKLNHDTGNYLESLFVGDLSKSIRNGGKYRLAPMPICRPTRSAVNWRRTGTGKKAHSGW